MITKEEAINKLNKAGFNAVDDNSTVTILIPPKASIKSTLKTVKELMIKIDYNASFGIKQHVSALSDEECENDISSALANTAQDGIEVDLESDIIDSIDSVLTDDAGTESISLIKDVKNHSHSISPDETNIESIDSSSSNDKRKSVSKLESVTVDESTNSSDYYFDDEDEDLEQIENIELKDIDDISMILNEEGIQFTLEDFGLI